MFQPNRVIITELMGLFFGLNLFAAIVSTSWFNAGVSGLLGVAIIINFITIAKE